MTGTGRVTDETSELTRLLHELGRQQPASRSADDESQRAEQIAARLDAELKTLVARRRRSIRVFAPLAAAAALLVGVGAWYGRSVRPSSLAIEQEPPSAGWQRRVTPPPDPPPEPVRAATPSVSAAKKEARPAPSALRSPEATGDELTAPTPSAEPASTLGAQNQLFREAVEAARSGDTAGALERLDRLLGSYPDSPLAQNALARKFRLLSAAGQQQAAATEARRYLRQYPTGFAVSEADRIVREQPNDAGALPPGEH